MKVNVRAAWKKKWLLFMLGVVFVLMGCASGPPANKTAAVPLGSTSKEKTIHKIAVSEDKATTLVTIWASQPLSYTAVKHQFPLGVVLYFPDTALEGVQESYAPDSALIKAIQSSELKTKRRSSRIEIRLNEDVPYEVSRAENQVLVYLKNPVVGPEEVEETEEGLEVAQEVEPKAQPEAKPEPVAAPPVTTEGVKKPAWVTRIDFEMIEGGKSRLTVGTTSKVRCETERPSDKRLLLKLFDTRIPKFLKRPLITTRFKSAVDRILPVQTPKMGDTAVIVIELREEVPYRIEQKENLCLLDLEASTVPPRPMAEAERPDWVQGMKEAEVAVVKEAERPPEEPVVTETGKAYTGEKISLDFQDADVHNIFRILHEVSGKNFVIGNDVRGRVTLRLVNVPWDQVLDLILKMNKLGTVVEGNVVRIATLSTLEAEQKAIQAKMAAEQAAKEQEPLVTEYIAVNYAEAKKITKHLDEIKSDRGKVSVDERTNQIIIKDTLGYIQNAREVIERLDVVTPQVMIEARIVEVDSNFTRDLGVQWGGDVYGVGSDNDTNTIFGPVFQTWPIGTGLTESTSWNTERSQPWAQNLAVNLPPSTPSSGIGFHFGKIAGTSVNLDVRLLAMESQGKGKTISAPKVVTLDNKEAFITQGTEIPYQTIDEGTVSLKFVEAVLKLTVTPHITLDDRISMKINAKKDAPDWGNAVGGTPAIDKKEAETELLVDDGETIVIGGILTSTEQFTKKSVPFFSRIPLLGWLFKSKYTYEKKQELLIFITPKIIRLERSLQVTS